MAIDLKELDPMEFIDKDIFDILGIGEAASEKKDAIITEMVETIQGRVIMRALDLMGEEDGKVFGDLLAEGDDEKIKDFLIAKDVDLGKITAEESLLYKMEIINLFNKDNKAIN